LSCGERERPSRGRKPFLYFKEEREALVSTAAKEQTHGRFFLEMEGGR